MSTFPVGHPLNPLVLEPVDWFFVVSDPSDTADIDYAINPDPEGTNDAENATLTKGSNGGINDVLSAPSASTRAVERGAFFGAKAEANVGDLVLFSNEETGKWSGVYVITDLGSDDTPWVLTRVKSMDDESNAAVDVLVTLKNTLFHAQTDRTNLGAGYDALGTGGANDKYRFTVFHARDAVDASSIRTVVKYLTDAQIKALPTTPVSILNSPGTGVSYAVVSARAYLDTRGAVYVAAANASWQLTLGELVGEPVKVQAALQEQAVNTVPLVLPRSQTGSSPFATTGTLEAGVTEDCALTISDTVGAVAAYTGGNAANKLKVVVQYVLDSCEGANVGG